ncbi:PE-PGRS family protein [Saccharopolyspora flava]|uniref:Novel toxin 11 n=1 Tax=Saccharopolyspora flava TaxID=95161 RepID=A0A1I6UD71_9PSEU|nr:PE-PGRS family protein [Saccharopolyspora flava]SFS99328.1 Novel toxin 11 [Saccharopolyspora flava]
MAAPDGGWWLGKQVSARKLESDLMRRLKQGPLFSADEVRAIREQERGWLALTGIGTYDDAVAYSRNGEYYDWLRLSPGKRLLIATLEFRERVRGGEQGSPAYTLGRTLTANTLDPSGRAPLDAERDAQIRNAFVDTLHPAEPTGRSDPAAEAKQANAQQLLTRVFLILQNGLKIRPGPGQEHIDYRDGDVARALAHGGRVNIRIPPLSGEVPGCYELAQWLEITDERGELTDRVSERTYATHYQSIGRERGDREGKFKERGGLISSARNLATQLTKDPVLVLGMNAGMTGLNKFDCNGDVVMPDGAHGHLLLIYTPPQPNTAGSLVVGLETLAPGNHNSPVGYEHTWRSTEARANPESSVHGHKQDKIGAGKLSENQRYVNLAEFGGPETPWPKFLRDVERDYKARMSAARDVDEQRELVTRLVGPRGEGRFPQA